MNSYLLNRSLGSISPEAFQLAQSNRLVRAIDPAPTVCFTSNTGNNAGEPSEGTNINDGADVQEEKVEGWAHKSGVNCLAIDRFEGRLYAGTLPPFYTPLTRFLECSAEVLTLQSTCGTSKMPPTRFITASTDLSPPSPSKPQATVLPLRPPAGPHCSNSALFAGPPLPSTPAP